MYNRLLLAVSMIAVLAAPELASADPQTDSATMQAPAATSTSPAPATDQAAPAAQAAPAQTTPAQTADSADLDRVECRSSPPPTGTRLGATRECHTVRQWNEREQEQQRMLQRMQSVGSKQGG